ncbi:hypothetical protein QE152_g12705 [Popillia japonica]|uniref:Uncharacterized protein n=1 Tax=Popillia japonica TaxID=7064 RepID=A0AAW1LQL3_POPJA
MSSTYRSANASSNTIEQRIENVILDDSSEGEDNIVVANDTPLVWRNVDSQTMRNIGFSVQDSGIKAEVFDMYDKDHIDFFQFFIDDKIWKMIVDETNEIFAISIRNI